MQLTECLQTHSVFPTSHNTVQGVVVRKTSALCQYVDVCISNEEDAKDVFGIEAEGTDIYGGKLNHEGYKSVAKQLADKFGFEKVAITLRTSISANDNDWAGMLYDGEDYYF